ncbi:hypothetical protein GCM10010191_68630 [Actinomadura vinacea]|uniref:Transposase n=1 Tax=Actinomadura vinacea TaxID=115336 RepID=A0ABP5X1Q3_9ACTN
MPLPTREFPGSIKQHTKARVFPLRVAILGRLITGLLKHRVDTSGKLRSVLRLHQLTGQHGPQGARVLAPPQADARKPAPQFVHDLIKIGLDRQAI